MPKVFQKCSLVSLAFSVSSAKQVCRKAATKLPNKYKANVFKKKAIGFARSDLKVLRHKFPSFQGIDRIPKDYSNTFFKNVRKPRSLQRKFSKRAQNIGKHFFKKAHATLSQMVQTFTEALSQKFNICRKLSKCSRKLSKSFGKVLRQFAEVFKTIRKHCQKFRNKLFMLEKR